MPTNGWSKYQQLVLYRLDEQDKTMHEIKEDVKELKDSMTVVKFKLALIGMASGTGASSLFAAIGFGINWYFKL